MLEKEIIQQRGFRNIEKDGEVIGFQVRVRSAYYRGIYLSELFPGSMLVDGKVYPKEQVIWEVNGKEFTNEEMKTAGDEHWVCTNDAATLKVYVPGGLKQGYHDVEVRFCNMASYLPPQLQEHMDPDEELPESEIVSIPGIIEGQGRYRRRLLLV